MKNVPRARNKNRLIRASIACAAILGGTQATGQQSLDLILENGMVVPRKKPPAAATTTKPAKQPPSAAPAARTAAPAAASAGFRMDLPTGWRAQLVQNGAIVAAGQDGSAVVIAPILGTGGADAGTWLHGSGAAAVGQYLKSAMMTGIYQSRMGPSAALASFDYAGPSGAGAANVLCFLNEGVGTLYLIAGPKAAFPQQRSGLVRILRSFSFTGERTDGGETAQAASQTNFTRFRDPNEGAFTVDVPLGWKVEGGSVRKSSLDIRVYAWVTSPDGSTIIRLQDPTLGRFCIPDQGLARARIYEGMPYSPGYGNVYLVSRYLPGPQFAQQYAMKFAGETQASNLQFKAVNPRQDLTKSTNSGIMQEQTIGGEAGFTCVRNGQEYAGFVVAATHLHVSSLMPGSAMWDVAYLGSYLTPQERAGATDRIFQHMVASVQWNPKWAEMQLQITRNTSQIARDTAQYTARVFDEVHGNRERSEERIHQNRIDTIRGVVRLKDPNTGEELEGVAGRNYYYRAPGRGAFGAEREIRSPDLTELEQIR